MTADDVKFSMDRILDEKKASPSRAIFEPISKVEVVDSHTVKFTLKRPFAPFLAYMGTVNRSAIVPKEAVATLNTAPVGTGPFKWGEFKPDQYVRLLKNEHYWEKGLPYLDALELKLIPDDNAQVAALRSKTVAMTWLKDPKVAANVARTTQGLISLPGSTTRFIDILFHHQKKPWDDVRVRRALALSIDRQAVVDNVLGGFGAVGTYIPAGVYAHPNPKSLPYYTRDVAKAKELLQEAGLTTVSDEWKIVAANALDVQMAETVKVQVAEAGFNLKLNPMEVGAILDDGRTGNHTLISIGQVWNPDPDALGFTRFHSTGATSKARAWKDDVLDKLLEDGRVATDEKKRAEIYHKVQERIADQVAQIAVYVYPLRWELTWDFVKGYKPTAANSRVYLRETWLDR